MAPQISIENIADYVGQNVTIKGWLYNSTHKGKLMFLRLRDGSGMTQGVAFRPDVGDELFETLKGLGQGIFAHRHWAGEGKQPGPWLA